MHYFYSVVFIFIKIVWLPTFSHPIVQMYNITFQSLYVTLIKRFLTIRRKTNSGGEGTKIPRDENSGDENSGDENSRDESSATHSNYPLGKL